MVTSHEEAGDRPATDVPIGELIDGLDEIASQPIPYARLPGRTRSFYAADFTSWGDLADETVRSLINRPKGGEATVRAILAAATESVATARAIPVTPSPADAPTAVEGSTHHGDEEAA